MQNVVGQAVVGDDLYGREREIKELWQGLANGEHIHMLAPRRVGKTSLMVDLKRNPQAPWYVVYIDAQGAESPVDCVTGIVAGLAASPNHRTWLESLPLGRSVANLWSRLQSGEVNIPMLRVELRSALGAEWAEAMDALLGRLEGLPADSRLLIIVDELPVLISRLLDKDGGRDQAELLLAKLRAWRQSPELRGKVQMLVGGSIGLDGILRRVGLSALINDLVPFRVEAWDGPTAIAFLRSLGRDCNFELADERVGQVLDLLGEPVPYHLQLFFRELQRQVGTDASAVTAQHVTNCFANRLTGPGGTPYLDHYGTRLQTALDEEHYTAAMAILALACAREGVAMAVIATLAEGQEPIYRAVLNELEFDGYVRRHEGQLVFRSNLLRTWWRKHRSGVEW